MEWPVEEHFSFFVSVELEDVCVALATVMSKSNHSDPSPL